MPVIRYWNPGMELSVQHSKSKETEPRLIMTFADKTETVSDEEGNGRTTTQILRAHHFAHDELFEQLMKVEGGANAEQLQLSLKQQRETAKRQSAEAQSS